ncbi:hypothetical protein [Noviherbaspirillum sp. Root189]|uniref:hypothetical protein n=1 Tax=Noviherbaspirillum sp. Root189 TaxID=1736487 RepID=UPI00070C9DE1|nr:hypothetical protein [Noviherbaspirillum sp. Root189]KRB79205.1 hypothetical protein ASE07_05905 [Noviherbaspirillum sp. Root189]
MRHYNHTAVFNIHGSSVSTGQNYLDLDPAYRDVWAAATTGGAQGPGGGGGGSGSGPTGNPTGGTR